MITRLVPFAKVHRHSAMASDPGMVIPPEPNTLLRLRSGMYQFAVNFM